MSESCEIFLTPDEVKRLTGYKRPHDQRRWLVAHGWAFEPDCLGRPVIPREILNKRFGLNTTEDKPSNQATARTWKLDLSKVN